MTGLLGRAMATIKGWWNTASTAVLGLLRGAVRVVGAASAALMAIRERRRERMARDPAYRTTIASGLSALLVTVTPQPAVAAALGVLVSEHLGSPHQSQETGYGFDDEQDEYEAYDTRRCWSSPSSRPPQRLWDRYTE